MHEEQEEVVDRKSDETEGTDVEEPFSPSATSAKETFDLDLDKCVSSPISHSPPEPISPYLHYGPQLFHQEVQ